MAGAIGLVAAQPGPSLTGNSCAALSTSPSRTLPDLCVGGIEFDLGHHVRYRIGHRGAPYTGTYTVAVYLDGALADQQTVRNPIQPLGGQVAVHAVVTDCQLHDVKVVVDPANGIAEADETNNAAAIRVVPCPDVTGNVEQDLTNNGLTYKARLVVYNKGQAPMPSVTVRALGAPWSHTGTPPAPDDCLTDLTLDCLKDAREVGPLAPGQRIEYRAGPSFRRDQTVFVQVLIHCSASGPCIETDTTNNRVTKQLGPH